MKKVAFILIITALSIGGSGIVLDQMLAKHGGIGYVSSAIEAMKLRSAKPGMPPEMIAAEAAKANKGAMGLMKVLADGAANGFGKPPSDAAKNETAAAGHAPANEVYIRASENHDVMLNSQLATAGVDGKIKGAAEDIEAAHKVRVQDTADGREVIGIVRDPSVEDLSAVDRINAMNIPDDLREKILQNYYATGSLPEIVVKETRKPAVKASGDPDDPYNPKNF